MKIALIIVAPLVALAGCSTRLVVHDEKGDSLGGFPVRVSEAYVVGGLFTGRADGAECEPRPFTEFMALPTGDLTYVNVTKGFLSKSELDLEFNDNGSVKLVSLNSEPAAKEALEGAGSLITAALPLFGVAGAEDDDDKGAEFAPAPDDAADCNAEKEYIANTLQRLPV